MLAILSTLVILVRIVNPLQYPNTTTTTTTAEYYPVSWWFTALSKVIFPTKERPCIQSMNNLGQRLRVIQILPSKHVDTDWYVLFTVSVQDNFSKTSTSPCKKWCLEDDFLKIKRVIFSGRYHFMVCFYRWMSFFEPKKTWVLLKNRSQAFIFAGSSFEVNQLQSSLHAFAALRSDGSVITWGRIGDGGSSKALQHQSLWDGKDDG